MSALNHSPIVVVGSVALDTIETPFGREADVLGGSATYFSAAASFFSSVRLVAIVGEDFPRDGLDFLAARGVDTSGVQRSPGRTFRWSGRYYSNLNDRETLDTQLNVFSDFRPKLPDAWRDVPYLFLANIHPALQLDVLDQARGARFVAMDTMNFWIEREPDALRRVLARVNGLVINDAEALQLSGERNVVRAARAIRAMGPSAVVIKRGEHGASLFDEAGVFCIPAYPLADVTDPTGAGDTFAGGFVGCLGHLGRHDAAALRQAMVVGAVMASFTVEKFGPERLRALQLSEVAQRFRGFRSLTEFEDIPALRG